MQKYIMIKKELEQKHVGAIQRMCKGNELLAYIFLTSVADILLYKIYDKELVKTLSPRYMPESEEEKQQLVFIENTICEADTFRKFINEVKNATVNTYKRQTFVNYDKKSKAELFKKKNVVLSYAPIHKTSVEQILTDTIKNELVVCVDSTNVGMEFSVYFSEESYQSETIEHLFTSYCFMLDQILENMDIIIDDINIVNHEEKNIILTQYSQTSNMKNEFTNIISMFEESVEKFPDNIAVSYEGCELTYKELEKKANRLSVEIQKLGLEHNSVVAVIADYSIEMIVSILGVLKSGNCYLPVDVDCPKQRKEYMLQDSSAKAIVLAAVNEEIDLEDVPVLDLKKINNENEEVQQTNIQGSDLAYIIYTSGTTGKPKKVEIEHHSVVNLFTCRNKEYGITSQDKILELLSFEFDGFGTNLYSALLSGAELIIPDSQKKGDFVYINELIDKKKVTNMSLVPSLCSAILMNRTEEIPSMKSVILAGEKSNNKVIELANRRTPDALYINEYGPTENCIVTTFWKNDKKVNASVIGRPINNVQVYILNKKMQVLPVGVWGELYIAGEGLARKADVANKKAGIKTVDNPFVEGEKLYPTGDYVRWIENGLIEFKGRIDQQIKIRGYRVELSEIEQAISQFNEIDDCSVISKSDNDGNMLLCAFVVSSKNIDLVELRKKLASCVPEYMLPAKFINIDSLPLTSNGKVSKDKLLDIYEKHYMNRTIVAPKNQVEEQLLNIWKNVLNNIEISTTDSFFEVGGNSLLLTQVISRIEEQLHVSLNVTDLFAYPTISELALKVSSKETTDEKLKKMKYTSLPEEYFCVNNGPDKMKKYLLEYDNESILGVKTFCEKNDMEIEKYLTICLYFAISKVSKENEICFYMDSKAECNLKEYLIEKKEFNEFQQILEVFSNTNVQDYKLLECKREKNEASFLLSSHNNFVQNNSTLDILSLFDVVILHQWNKNSLSIEFYIKNILSDSVHQEFTQLFGKLVNGLKDFY